MSTQLQSLDIVGGASTTRSFSSGPCMSPSVVPPVCAPPTTASLLKRRSAEPVGKHVPSATRGISAGQLPTSCQEPKCGMTASLPTLGRRRRALPQAPLPEDTPSSLTCCPSA